MEKVENYRENAKPSASTETETQMQQQVDLNDRNQRLLMPLNASVCSLYC